MAASSSATSTTSQEGYSYSPAGTMLGLWNKGSRGNMPVLHPRIFQFLRMELLCGNKQRGAAAQQGLLCQRSGSLSPDWSEIPRQTLEARRRVRRCAHERPAMEQ